MATVTSVSIRVEKDNTDEVIREMNKDVHRALEMIGGEAERFAKALSPVGTPESTGIPGYMGGTLRNSITHKVVDDEDAVYIGSNVEYAPYVEMGTVKMKARPFLKPAVENHTDYYKRIIENELKR